MRKHVRKVSGGRKFQIEERKTKTLRGEHTWYVSAAAGNPVWLTVPKEERS